MNGTPSVPGYASGEPRSSDCAGGDERPRAEQALPGPDLDAAEHLAAGDRERHRGGCDDALDERPVDAIGAEERLRRDERELRLAPAGIGLRVRSGRRDHGTDAVAA